MSVKKGQTTIAGNVSDANLVHKINNEYINGIKTFNVSPKTDSVTPYEEMDAEDLVSVGQLNQALGDIKTSSLTFIGFVSTTDPSATYNIKKGNLWITGSTMPTTFPVPASNIKVWNGTIWVPSEDTYTPDDFDFFRDVDDNEGYYWFGGEWVVMSTDMDTTYFQLDQNSGKWIINPTYDEDLVHITRDETITGDKTFTGAVNLPSTTKMVKQDDQLEGGQLNFEKGDADTSIDGDVIADVYNGLFRIYAYSNGSLTVPFAVDFINNRINATAYRALWGDLAEYYEADKKYKPGTLLQIGGEKEVTLATTEANFVVSSKPGLIIGEGEEKKKNNTLCALIGKVPVRVDCEVKKGDKLYFSNNGFASNVKNGNVIGIALEDGNELVLSSVKLNF